MKKLIFLSITLSFIFNSCAKFDNASGEQNEIKDNSYSASKLDGDNGGESEFEWVVYTFHDKICWIDPNTFSGDDLGSLRYEEPKWTAEHKIVYTGSHTYNTLVCRTPGKSCGRLYTFNETNGIVYVGLYEVLQ